MNEDIILEVKNLVKSFEETKALKGVDLTIRSGEIHGLVGENGSGKSTATSIIAGMQQADSGEMIYLGKPWNPQTMLQAQNLGVSMILQEANTIPGATVAENLFVGEESLFATCGFMNKKKMNRQADRLLDELSLSRFHSSDLIDSYTFEDRKLIEIVRVLKKKTRVLIVDETTTALSHNGREFLYDLIRKKAGEGNAVIIISHDLDEIMNICNVLTVLRDGEIVADLSREEMEPKKIRQYMVGRDIGDKYFRTDFEPTAQEEVTLSLEQISFDGRAPFDVILHKGEIVGIGGLSDSGMHRVGKVAFGIEKNSGKVHRKDQEIKNTNQAVKSGIAYISKDRDREAIILDGNIKENILLPVLANIKKSLFVSPAKERKIVKEEVDFLSIKCSSPMQKVANLSGGNKQKVSFARWIARDSEVFIMDCPTRGVDIGVKQTMYQLMEDMKKEGKSILMISEELTELIGMCDRMLIMKECELKKEFLRNADLKESDIIEYMI
ncbi:MAG: sugar ABC transporter ATP-binding protein [Parasporobacterium sp.]|nr:sugar ABC transporter ATP-binding protein [Parasporobacterium sp.]